MKAVVLTLALLFLTGSQAQHETQQEEPPSQWERVKALAQVYLNSAKVSGRKYIVKFEETELAKKLDLKVLAKLDTLRDKVANLTEQLGLPSQNFWTKMKNEVEMLTRELNKNLTEVMKPYLEGIQKKWQERVEPLGQDLRERAQELQKKLGQLGAKVRDGARPHVERARELHTILESVGGELRQCLEPYAEQLQALREGVGLAELREQVEPTLGEMHKDLQPLWESLQDAFLPFLYGMDIEDISRRLAGQ